MPGAIVVGAGPGVGTSVARRLAREGLTVGVIARTEATVDDALSALSDYDALGVTADVTDEVGLRAALDEIVDRFGVPELLVYNAALIQSDSLGELTAQQHLDAWAVNVVGAITAATHLAPQMVRHGDRHDHHHRRHARAPARGNEPVARQEPGSERSHNSSPRRTARPVCTSRPSRSPARWRPGPDSIPTTSPSTTGGCTPSRRKLGNTRSSTRILRRRSGPAQAAGRRASDTDERTSGALRQSGTTVSVLLISGSSRDGSTNTAVLRTAAALAPAEIDTVLLAASVTCRCSTPTTTPKESPCIPPWPRCEPKSPVPTRS